MKEHGDLKTQEAQVMAQVAERKEMAFNKDLYKKIRFIATHLGKEERDYSDDMDQTTIRYKLATETISIEFSMTVNGHRDLDEKDDGFASVSINKDGKESNLFMGFKEKKEIRCYIPGEWEKELDSLVAKAKDIIKQQKNAEKEEERQHKLNEIKSLKDSFGL